MARARDIRWLLLPSLALFASLSHAQDSADAGTADVVPKPDGPAEQAEPRPGSQPPPARATSDADQPAPPTTTKAPIGPAREPSSTQPEPGWDDPSSDAVGFADEASPEGIADDNDAVDFGGGDAWGTEGSDDAGFGDGDAWGEDGSDAAGFGAEERQATSPVEESPGELSATGSIREQAGLWALRLGDVPLAQARTSIDGEVRYKKRTFGLGVPLTLRIQVGGHAERDLAYLVDRGKYDAATLDAYEGQLIGGETFLSLAHGPAELTLGRQIVNLGRGDVFSPLDVVNPRDLREPGLAELQDVRMAVMASRLGFFSGYHRVEVLVVHEAYFGLRPPPRAFYSPFRNTLSEGLLADLDVRYRDLPKRYDAKNQQLLMRYGYAGPGGDVALIAGSVLDQQVIVDGQAILGKLLQDPIALLQSPPTALTIPLSHPRYELVGATAAMPAGDFVLRAELGLDVGRSFMSTGPVGNAQDPFGLPHVVRGEQLNWMAGLVYSGIEDGTLTLEYTGRHLFAAPAGFARPAIPDVGVLYRQDLLRQRLHLTVAAMAFGVFDQSFQGALGRIQVDYDVADGLSAGLGYITYRPVGDADTITALAGYEKNDRLFLNLRFHFLLD